MDRTLAGRWLGPHPGRLRKYPRHRRHRPDCPGHRLPVRGLPSGDRILIAYFSVPETDGVDTVSGASRVVVDGTVLGNNQYLAQLLQGETGGDLFRIETVQTIPQPRCPAGLRLPGAERRGQTCPGHPAGEPGPV